MLWVPKAKAKAILPKIYVFMETQAKLSIDYHHISLLSLKAPNTTIAQFENTVDPDETNPDENLSSESTMFAF